MHMLGEIMSPGAGAVITMGRADVLASQVPWVTLLLQL